MAKADNGNQKALKGKLLINAKLQVVTGMHIGGGSDFAPIGAVDSPFVRDPLTHAPIIPGSSIKGKMRTLLAKSMCSGYVLNTVDTDADVIARSFGSSAKNNLMPARLQFFDLFLTDEMIISVQTMRIAGIIAFKRGMSGSSIGMEQISDIRSVVISSDTSSSPICRLPIIFIDTVSSK